VSVEILNLYGSTDATATDTIDFGETLGRNVYLVQQAIVVNRTAAQLALTRNAAGIVGGNPNMCRWEAQRGGATFETIPRGYWWNAEQRTSGAGTCNGLPITASDEQPVKMVQIMRYIQDIDNLRFIVSADIQAADYRGWVWYVKVR